MTKCHATFGAAVGLALLLTFGPVSNAAPGPASERLSTTLVLEAGTGRVVTLGANAASVFAADPKIAEVRPASPTTLFVFAIAPGRTTVVAVGDAGLPIAQYDITVRPSNYGASQAQGVIARSLPGRPIRVDAQSNGLVISGEVQTPAQAEIAVQTARGYVGENGVVDNRLAVRGSTQVNLRVRIAEMSRNVTRQLGVNWQSLANLGASVAVGVTTALPLADSTLAASRLTAGYNSGAGGRTLDINGMIDALAQDQLVHILAEPNLTALSGETASFLVGGEFPIPVAQQGNQIAIEFKQYGISLAFIPTVASSGRITIKVRPEVSALTSLGAVQLGVGNSSIQVPALTVRRAETTVELASGQSFAIAGLLQDSTTMTGNAIPGLGDVPILGALFRSDGFQRHETELVIVVTPYLVRPVTSTAQLRLPTDGWRPPTDLERILLLRQTGRSPTQTVASAPRIPGDAGFLVQ